MSKKGIVRVLALLALVLAVLNIKTWSLDRVHVHPERAKVASERWGKDVETILMLFNGYEAEIGQLPREGASLLDISEISLKYADELEGLEVSPNARGLKASMGEYFGAAGVPMERAGKLQGVDVEASRAIVHESIKKQALAFRGFVDELKLQVGEIDELENLEALAQQMEELAAQFPSAQV